MSEKHNGMFTNMVKDEFEKIILSRDGEELKIPGESGYINVIVKPYEDAFHYSFCYNSKLKYHIVLYINKDYKNVRDKLKEKWQKRKFDIFDSNWLNARDNYSGRFCLQLGICDPQLVAQVLRLYINYTKDDVLNEINRI